jgi:crotonobetaine/carnitine-CoA ligase
VNDFVGNRTVSDLLDERVEEHPEREFVRFEAADGRETAYTYDAFLETVERLANGLESLGIKAGDKVALHLPNCPEMITAMFAVAQLGAVFVPSNIHNTATEMEHVLGYSDARLLITSPHFVDLFAEVLPGVPNVQEVILTGRDYADLLGAGRRTARTRTSSEEPLEMLFTSGTTAAPKGVLLTHANWLWSGERATHMLMTDPTDRFLTALPAFHVNAQSTTLLAALTVGARAIFLEEYRATRYWGQVRRHDATRISLVAMLLRTLLAQPEHDDDRAHKLRTVIYSINIPTEEKERFERRFGVALQNAYGLTEAMTTVAIAPLHGARRWPSIGRPAIDRQIRLVDADGKDVATGESGEILVQGVPGRTLMKGYYKDESATAAALAGGWLHTGDNGRFDEQGYLYFVDRKKDVIKRAGENISATEVEGVLADHPGIALAAVIGVPDAIRDEAVMAFIVMAAGSTLTAEDVSAYCLDRLARFKVPTIIEFRDVLPQTSIGKIEKKQLRAEVAERMTVRPGR